MAVSSAMRSSAFLLASKADRSAFKALISACTAHSSVSIPLMRPWPAVVMLSISDCMAAFLASRSERSGCCARISAIVPWRSFSLVCKIGSSASIAWRPCCPFSICTLTSARRSLRSLPVALMRSSFSALARLCFSVAALICASGNACPQVGHWHDPVYSWASILLHSSRRPSISFSRPAMRPWLPWISRLIRLRC